MEQKKFEILYKKISKLSRSEKRILLTRLVNEVSFSEDKNSSQSICEIKGIGKEIWNDIDAQDHVNNERNSWT